MPAYFSLGIKLGGCGMSLTINVSGSRLLLVLPGALHDEIRDQREEAIAPFLIDTQKDQKNVLFISLSVLSGNRIFRSSLS